MADRRRNLGIPSGVVFPFAGDTAPYGYLICDGRPVSRTEYASLFLMIGTSHGQGDGSTTFNLPDYRGNFLRGKVDINTINGTGSVISPNQATFTNHGINRTGFKVRLSSGTLSGLAASTDYFAIVVDANTLAFASSQANALANTRIAISGVNSAVITQFEDPTASSRMQHTTGSNIGNSTGGFQECAFEAHDHWYRYRERTGAVPFPGTEIAPRDSTGYQADSDLHKVRYITETNNYTGTSSVETRPKNVLVNYIIKI